MGGWGNKLIVNTLNYHLKGLEEKEEEGRERRKETPQLYSNGQNQYWQGQGSAPGRNEKWRHEKNHKNNLRRKGCSRPIRFSLKE